jgi:hypothetical protein
LGPFPTYPRIQKVQLMPQFTVIGKKRVFRVKAKSVQALTKALRSVGIVWQGIHEDKESARG